MAMLPIVATGVYKGRPVELYDTHEFKYDRGIIKDAVVFEIEFKDDGSRILLDSKDLELFIEINQ